MQDSMYGVKAKKISVSSTFALVANLSIPQS